MSGGRRVGLDENERELNGERIVVWAQVGMIWLAYLANGQTLNFLELHI